MPPRPPPFKKNKRPYYKPLPATPASSSYKSKMAYGAASALASLHPYSRAALIGTRLAYNAYKRYTYKPPPGPRTLNGRTRTTDSGNYGLSGEIAMYKQGVCPSSWISNPRDQHIKLTQSSTYSITAQTGRQAVQQGSAVWNTSDINAMLSAVSTQLLVTAGSSMASNSTATNLYRIGTCSSVAEILNQTSQPVTLTVYTCQLRQDANDPFTLNNDWNNGYNFTNAFPNNINAIGSVTTSNIIDTTPYQSPYFTVKYKVLNVKKFMIDAGATVKHKIHINRKKILNAARIQTSGTVGQGGLTTVRLYVLRGGINNASADSNQISTGQAEVSIIENTRYEMAQAAGNRTINAVGNILPQTLTNPVHMGEYVQSTRGNTLA